MHFPRMSTSTFNNHKAPNCCRFVELMVVVVVVVSSNSVPYVLGKRSSTRAHLFRLYLGGKGEGACQRPNKNDKNLISVDNILKTFLLRTFC